MLIAVFGMFFIFRQINFVGLKKSRKKSVKFLDDDDDGDGG
jgi:hypothetical protein